MSIPEHQARLLLDHRCEHAEGPVWDAVGGRLYWVDITGCRLHSWQPGDSMPDTWELPEPVCAVSPQADGHLLIALAKQLVLADPRRRTVEPVCAVEPDRPGNRCNDGKADPAGRFWVGTMSHDGMAEGAGALYCLDCDGMLRRVLGQLTIANGMGWSADAKTMYFIDSPARAVWAFDFDLRGVALTHRRTVVDLSGHPGVPDGMTVAPDGTLWVAQWGEGCVNRWDPASGKLLERVLTGCPHTSSCCLGDGGALYITTSRLGLDAGQLAAAPLSGSLFIHDTHTT